MGVTQELADVCLPVASQSVASPSHVTAVRVADEAFLVSSTVERCPKTMMIRELVVNAIKAARAAPTEKRVDILAVAIEVVPKLCIRTTGHRLASPAAR